MAKRCGTPNYALREARARGDKFYIPDFLCNNGHMTKRLTSSGACYECSKANTSRNNKKMRQGPDGDIFRAKNNAVLRAWKNKPENIDRVREYARRDQAKHRKKHPINGRVDLANLRAKRLGIDGRVCVEEIEIILMNQSNKCASCADGLLPNWNLDHIMPLRLRGLNKMENIQILCHPCNKAKGYMHPQDWDRLKHILRPTCIFP